MCGSRQRFRNFVVNNDSDGADESTYSLCPAAVPASGRRSSPVVDDISQSARFVWIGYFFMRTLTYSIR